MQKMSLLLIAVTFVPLAAQAAPQGLYGKTVKVTWTETRSQRNPGETSFHPVGLPFTFEVYVSGQGNLFKRLTSVASTGRQIGSKDRAGTGGSGPNGAGQVSFQGNTMVSTSSSGGLGRRIRIVLDNSFSSCSAEVISGKSGAGPASVVSVATGQTVQFESVSAGAASCSIQAGNAFAN